MKQRKGRRLIVETYPSGTDKTGPVAAGEFPNAFWAWAFQHFEDHVPPRIAVDQTTWRGFRNWHDAVRWLEEKPREDHQRRPGQL